MKRLLVHVPHASTDIPRQYLTDYRIPDLDAELLRMTDWYCDDLFDCGQDMLVFPYSRLLCDVERFREDGDEIMASVGMGLAYTRTADGRVLREVSADRLEEILQRYYDPHHARLTEAVQARLDRFSSCLIVDGHSFHPTPLPYERDQSDNRPDICIGVDDFHTPAEVQELCMKYLSDQGYIVEINRPFAGTIVPMRFWQREAAVWSVMLELNRRIYMDGDGAKTERYPQVKQALAGLINRLEEL